MNKIVYDLIQIVAVLLIGGGTYGEWGGNVSSIVVGFTLLVLTLIDLLLTRKR